MRSLNMLMILTFWYRRVWCDGTDESENAVGWFLSWSENNSMHSNPKKCKELTFRKMAIRKSWNWCRTFLSVERWLTGGYFSNNNIFNTHVHEKLIKANMCLYVIRTLKAEGYCRAELNCLFDSLIISIINYGLSVYGCSLPELNTFKGFLTDVTDENI